MDDQNLQDDDDKQSIATLKPNLWLSFKHKLQSMAYSTITNISWHPNGTVNRRLLNLIDIRTPTSTTPINSVITSDHTVDASRQLWFRLFVPIHRTTSDQTLPVIIYFHGGGFVFYSASTTPFDDICRRFAANSSAVVISVNYRPAPEHKFPAQYDDGFDMVKFLDSEIRDKVAEFPAAADLRRCFLVGDSSGGNLAHHVAVRCSPVNFKEVKICGLVMIQPFFGGEMRTESEIRVGTSEQLKKMDFYWKAFLPNGSSRDHPAANVFGGENSEECEAVASMEYPDTLVFIGGLDLLQDRQRRYVNWLRKCGKIVELVEYPDVHGLCCASHYPEYELLVAKVGQLKISKVWRRQT